MDDFKFKLMLSLEYQNVLDEQRFAGDLGTWINSSERDQKTFPAIYSTKEFAGWAKRNLKAPWEVRTEKFEPGEEERSIEISFAIYFTTEADMLLFKLRWAGV